MTLVQLFYYYFHFLYLLLSEINFSLFDIISLNSENKKKIQKNLLYNRINSHFSL